MVLSRVEDVGYTEDDEDVQIVSELMDNIRDVVIDYQVSCDPKPFLRSPLFRQWSRRRTNRQYTSRISNLL